MCLDVPGSSPDSNLKQAISQSPYPILDHPTQKHFRTPRPLCIYVTGPLAGYIEQNIRLAMEAGIALIQRGHHPLIPHLSQHVDSFARNVIGITILYERWIAMDLAWLERADAILYLAPSPGADRELSHAVELGLIVYRSIDEVPVFDGIESAVVGS